jgi:predicted TIM-barrel fold metal-dependent hydrolase
MATKNRIDVHQHVVPPFWAAALPSHGGDPSGWSSPQWTPDSAIAFMDAHEIDKGVLSLTAPGVTGWTGDSRRDVARRVNEYTAGLVSKRPTRFGNFATLPLPDVDGAILELGHAFDTLRADGVVLLSNYEGHYLGDPLFDPLWAELDRAAAVMFIHPAKPALPVIKELPGPMVDYPFDTTRTAVHLAIHGVLERYPRVRIILAHAGGFLPYAAHRFAKLAAAVRPEGPSPESLLATFKQFYFDTALSSGSEALHSLRSFAGAGHILYGSDFPYAPAAVGAAFTSMLDGNDTLSVQEKAAINQGNAQRVFGGRGSSTDVIQPRSETRIVAVG